MKFRFRNLFRISEVRFRIFCFLISNGLSYNGITHPWGGCNPGSIPGSPTKLNAFIDSQDMIKYIVFDFDGTIADTYPHVLKIVSGLKKNDARNFNFDEIKNEGVKRLIKKAGIPLWKIPNLIYKILTELRKKDDIKIFPELSGVIKILYNKYKLGIISSNSAENIEKFLKKHGLIKSFNFVYSGSSLFGKNLALKRMCEKHKFNPREVLYVADEDRDIGAAKKAGIKIVAVTWGYNAAEILKKEKPDYLIDSPKQILEMVSLIK